MTAARKKCESCDSNLATCHRTTKDGTKKYGKFCSPCKKKSYQKYKEAVCSSCGFVPEHSCQLDVDHIDGDRRNQDPTNFQTLCANCHRLKTYVNGDYYNKT